MKLIIVVLAFVAVVAAAPQQAAAPWQILRAEINQQPDGTYSRNYETENGISQSETGEIKQVSGEDNKPVNVLVMRGSFSYTDPDNKVHSVNYYADETGFHAESADIPVAVSARR